MNKSLRLDFYIVLGTILLSMPLVLLFQLRPLTSALLFFVTPSIYLALRKKKPIQEIIYGSLLIGGALGFIFDILATVNHAWYVPTSQLVINYRIFGFWPVDEIIWFILWASSILFFYEHFYERDRSDKISTRYKYIALPSAIAFLAVLLISYFSVEQLLIPYAYSLSVSLPIIFIVIYTARNKPGLVLKFIKTGVFFFMVYLAHELTAMKLGQWEFSGQYIGWVQLFGLSFPFEELLFWMGLSPFVVLAIYEGFVDNAK